MFKNPLFNLSLLALVIGAVMWWKHVPSAEGRFEAMRIDVDAGTIDFEGVTFFAEFGEPVTHEGDVRFVHTSYHEAAPVVTHEAVITTGEFSNPEIVEITPIREGSMRWQAERRPEGTLMVLHFIPATANVVLDLDALKEGQAVKVVGREVVNGRIDGSDGRWVRIMHPHNHRYLLVERVEI